MKTIYKYPLNPADLYILMPIGAKILSVAQQDNQICLWAEVDNEAPEGLVGFEVFGTGHEVPDNDREFIGTALINDGEFVFHVYKMI